MSKDHEDRVKELLNSKLAVNFTGKQKVLLNAAGESLGRADGIFEIDDNRAVFLEVETSQKHPSTNVLKYWPYLVAHTDKHILLIQCFFNDSPGLRSNRGRLAKWTAEKMGLDPILEGRFSYHRITLQKESFTAQQAEYNQLQNLVDGFIAKRINHAK